MVPATFLRIVVLGQMSLLKVSKILSARNHSFVVAKYIESFLGQPHTLDCVAATCIHQMVSQIMPVAKLLFMKTC